MVRMRGNMLSIIAIPSAACAIRRIGVLGGGLRRRRAGLRFPHPQRSELRIVGDQLAQGRGAGAGQPDDEHRTLDDLVVDLRMLLVGVDDLAAAGSGHC